MDKDIKAIQEIKELLIMLEGKSRLLSKYTQELLNRVSQDEHLNTMSGINNKVLYRHYFEKKLGNQQLETLCNYIRGLENLYAQLDTIIIEQDK